MKMKLYLIAVLLAAVLLFSAVPCYATSSAIVSGESITTTAGKDIEYRVSITGNPGLVGYRLKIRYDTSVLSLVSCSQGDFSSLGTTVCGEAESGCNVLWYHTFDVSTDGVLFILTFHIDDTAAEGNYPIAVSSDAMYCVNYAESLVPIRCTSGTVTIREFSPKLYGEKCSAMQGEELLFSVYLEDNPGIASYHIQVLFDPNVLEYADAEPGDQTCQLPADIFVGNVQRKFYPNAFEIIWYSQNDVSDEGALFSLRLRVKDAATIGASDVTVQYVTEDTLNAKEAPVTFSCLNGTVTVEREIEIHYSDAETATVTINGAKGQIIIAALYDENGRQLALVMKDSDAGSALLQLTSTVTGHEGVLCKVMTLSDSYTPLYAPITVPRTS